MRELCAAVVCLLLACKSEQPAPAVGTLAEAPAASLAPPMVDAQAPAMAVASPPDAAVDNAAAADGGACGKKPLPDCPLQAWMKLHMTPASNAQDFDALGAQLRMIAANAPTEPGYSNWASIAGDGARAAKVADIDGVRASCRGCHAQYKPKYRAELRQRPAPAP
jgi:hypothetical protein